MFNENKLICFFKTKIYTPLLSKGKKVCLVKMLSVIAFTKTFLHVHDSGAR